MAFGKYGDDTAVDLQRLSLSEASACMMGREAQHNIGEAALTGRMNLGNTCHQNGAVRWG